MIDSVIELQELRIGNFLEYKGKLVHVTTLSLDVDDECEETIGFCEYGKAHNEYADWNRALYLDLKRIPLTPEWLKWYGFNEKREEKHNEYEHEVYYILVVGDDKYSCGIVSETYGGEESKSWRFRCDDDIVYLKYSLVYVHQLQNLYYALTGEEIAINLSANPK